MAGEDDDKKKMMMVKAGVWVISIMIVLFWGVNLRNSFSASTPAEDNNLNSIEKEISQTVKEIKDSNSQPEKGQGLDDQAAGLINGLKEDIENRQGTVASPTANNAASSSPEISTSSPSSLPATSTVRQNCPQYINCMPTFGEPRPCVIPPGCENYTQIAY
ncbi:MAG: hypothetical protein ACM3PZ_01270 [Bacillota bacterium]